MRLAPMKTPVLPVMLVMLNSASSVTYVAWVISWIECELLGGSRAGVVFVFKLQNQLSEVELMELKIGARSQHPRRYVNRGRTSGITSV